MLKHLFLILSVLAYTAVSLAEPQLSSDAPEDKPFSATDEQFKRIDEAIAPYVKKARDTFPQAKERLLDGLPTGEIFFVTTRIVDPESRIEQAFIRVVTIQDGTITGTIASRIQLVSGYRYGDRYSLPESDILDWLIAKPDGTEEGNFVGRFLDEYQKALSGE